MAEIIKFLIQHDIKTVNAELIKVGQWLIRDSNSGKYLLYAKRFGQKKTHLMRTFLSKKDAFDDASNRINSKNIFLKTTKAAKKVLKKGDKIRTTRCGGITATYTFECWSGNWIVSKSGIDDIAACSIIKVNGKPRTF